MLKNKIKRILFFIILKDSKILIWKNILTLNALDSVQYEILIKQYVYISRFSCYMLHICSTDQWKIKTTKKRLNMIKINCDSSEFTDLNPIKSDCILVLLWRKFALSLALSNYVKHIRHRNKLLSNDKKFLCVYIIIKNKWN